MAEYRMVEESVTDVVNRMGVRSEVMGSTQGEVNRLIGVVEGHIADAQAQEAPLTTALADLESASADSLAAAEGADVTGRSWDSFRSADGQLDTSVRGSTENMKLLFAEFRNASNALMEELNLHRTDFDRYITDARNTNDEYVRAVDGFKTDVATVFDTAITAG